MDTLLMWYIDTLRQNTDTHKIKLSSKSQKLGYCLEWSPCLEYKKEITKDWGKRAGQLCSNKWKPGSRQLACPLLRQGNCLPLDIRRKADIDIRV